MRSKILHSAVITVLATFSFSPMAQTVHADPDQVRQDLFWGDLYADGGETLFCQESFTANPILMTEAAVYSLQSIRSELRCGTARRCERESEDYRRMASDLHNLFPETSRFAMRLRNEEYGEVEDYISTGDCGERSSYRTLEPAEHARGTIARALFYMHATYELPLPGDLHVLQQWNRDHPPGADEIARNDRIEELQGNANPFISDPSLGDQLL